MGGKIESTMKSPSIKWKIPKSSLKQGHFQPGGTNIQLSKILRSKIKLQKGIYEIHKAPKDTTS